jgi:hypothetical protein
MTGLTKPKLIAYLVAIFLAGGIAGGFIGYTSCPHRRFGPPSEEEMIRYVKQKLADEVGVTESQWTELAPIITTTVREIGQLDAQNRERIGELITRSDAAIMEKLTPEQRPRMERMMEERRKHHERRTGTEKR